MRTDSGILAGAVLFIAILTFPLQNDILPPAARFTAAVAVLMVTLWVTEAIPLAATALLPLIAFPLLGVLTVQQSAAPYADQIIFLFLGGFIIARAMERWNLHQRIALHIIRIAGTSPRRLILGFMAATAFISLWISNTATAMMMVPIAIAIGDSLVRNGRDAPSGMTTGETAFTGCLLLSVAWAASIGGMGTPIGSPPNGIFLAQMSTLLPDAPAIDFFELDDVWHPACPPADPCSMVVPDKAGISGYTFGYTGCTADHRYPHGGTRADEPGRNADPVRFCADRCGMDLQ